MTGIVTPKKPSYAFCIGDVDGQLDLLKKLVEELKTTYPNTFTKEADLIFLGNVIGDGPNSSGVLDYIYELDTEKDVNVVLLRGINEHGFIRMKTTWASSATGKQIVKSYRKQSSDNIYNKFTRNVLANGAIVSDRRWLSKRHSFYLTANHFFCSSGINPLMPIMKQNYAQLIYNGASNLFTENEVADYGRYIVYGKHVPPTLAKVEIKPNRANLNTQPTVTGTLGCAIIDLTVKGPSSILDTVYVSREESSGNAAINELLSQTAVS